MPSELKKMVVKRELVRRLKEYSWSGWPVTLEKVMMRGSSRSRKMEEGR